MVAERRGVNMKRGPPVGVADGKHKDRNHLLLPCETLCMECVCRNVYAGVNGEKRRGPVTLSPLRICTFRPKQADWDDKHAI